MIVHVVAFKRNKEDKVEKGVAMGENGIIIDTKGEVVPGIYELIPLYHEGSFVLRNEYDISSKSKY